MPTTQVTSGDLITAALMNEILQRLATVEGSAVAPAGNVTVPSVVGQKLSVARATIIAPSSQLNFGFVIDAAGKAVDALALDMKDLIVINQVPPGGTKVTAGVAVNLVVAASGAGGTPAPTPKPKINSVKPAKVPAGQQVELVGENFALSRFQNQVSFDATPAATPSPASGTTSLFVVVPKTLPNVPAGANEILVDVKVVTPEGQFILTKGLTVQAPLPGPDLAITKIEPGSITTGSDITITGTGFTADPTKHLVEFSVSGGAVTTAAPKTATTTVIVVTVPGSIVGVNAGGGGSTVNVVVNLKNTALRTPAKTITVEVAPVDL
jgi:IPT/TIG domain